MDITVRSLLTLIHGLGCGTLYLLSCSGALLELHRACTQPQNTELDGGRHRFVSAYLLVMAALAWLTVLSGTYLLYPWYRATPPPGTADLSLYPQRLLLSHPGTRAWHSIGMEWKEHVAWFTPMATTMVAFVFVRYGRDLRSHPGLRTAVLWFAAASFAAAGVAGFFGAMLDKNAPLQGGRTLHLTWKP